MSSVRESFVARFGEEDAARVEAAAALHQRDWVGDKGSDEFQWSFLSAVVYQCVSRFRNDHGIEATEDDLRAWALAEGNLADYDGDIPDFLAVLAGAYDGWLPRPEKEEASA